MRSCQMELLILIFLILLNLFIITLFVFHIKQLRFHPYNYKIPLVFGIVLSGLYVFCMIYASQTMYGEDMLGLVLFLIFGVPALIVYFIVIYVLSRIDNWFSYIFYTIIIAFFLLVLGILIYLLMFVEA